MIKIGKFRILDDEDLMKLKDESRIGALAKEYQKLIDGINMLARIVQMDDDTLSKALEDTIFNDLPEAVQSYLEYKYHFTTSSICRGFISSYLPTVVVIKRAKNKLKENKDE